MLLGRFKFYLYMYLSLLYLTKFIYLIYLFIYFLIYLFYTLLIEINLGSLTSHVREYHPLEGQSVHSFIHSFILRQPCDLWLFLFRFKPSLSKLIISRQLALTVTLKGCSDIRSHLFKHHKTIVRNLKASNYLASPVKKAHDPNPLLATPRGPWR